METRTKSRPSIVAWLPWPVTRRPAEFPRRFRLWYLVLLVTARVSACSDFLHPLTHSPLRPASTQVRTVPGRERPPRGPRTAFPEEASVRLGVRPPGHRGGELTAGPGRHLPCRPGPSAHALGLPRVSPTGARPLAGDPPQLPGIATGCVSPATHWRLSASHRLQVMTSGRRIASGRPSLSNTSRLSIRCVSLSKPPQFYRDVRFLLGKHPPRVQEGPSLTRCGHQVRRRSPD